MFYRLIVVLLLLCVYKVVHTQLVDIKCTSKLMKVMINLVNEENDTLIYLDKLKSYPGK